VELESVDKTIYLNSLDKFVERLNKVGRSPLKDFFKILVLTNMNMRYENLAFQQDHNEHPYLGTKRIIEESEVMLSHLLETSFIETEANLSPRNQSSLEARHKELWQEIWTKHSEEEYEEFIELKSSRIRNNQLMPFIDGKKCVDFGCGNGSFAFALLDFGASYVTGIDFGEKSIEYARTKARERKLMDRVEFHVRDVMNTGLPDNEFDCGIANGVFHHLGSKESMNRACSEVFRTLKPGGWFWLYVDGEGAISMDLWDATVAALTDIDIQTIISTLEIMNVSRNKMVHIVDGSKAEYLHSGINGVLEDLSKIGFTNPRFLSGGKGTDLDSHKIEQDTYGVEKFGCGDIRLFCQKPA